MTELEQAISEVKAEYTERGMFAEDTITGTILNAVATSQLLPSPEWTPETNILPWVALTMDQMRSFERSMGEIQRLALSGEWIDTDTPLSPGLVYRIKPAAPASEDAEIARLTRERDEARARVAAAYKTAAASTLLVGDHQRIEPLTPADAKAALDKALRQARADGMREAAQICIDLRQGWPAPTILSRATEIEEGRG